ncbi:MAG: DUF5301 domain-containing protein [Pseudoflavonifractor sp.]|nr:DUF5301 domain-containing protein [Pseudoflavonifractor sp.]
MNEVIKNFLMYELVFKILNMSITATFMALAVIFLRLLLRRAPKWISYALWGVVLFRLICPVSFSSEFSLLGGIGAPSAESGVVSYIPENLVHTAVPQVNMVFPGVNETIHSSLPQGEEQLVADPSEAPAAGATCLWLMGVATMLVYSVASYVLLKRRLSDATLLEGNVFETDAITSPFVCGLIKPRIYLPVDLPAPERGYVLLHERTHIRRRDYLVKPLAFLALSMHWFNPVMWLSFRLMCRDMEMSCDERVARELDPAGRSGYSAALARLATGRLILAGSPLAFGESGAKGRIKNILNYKKPTFWVVAAVVITCAAATVLLLANPAKTLDLPEATAILSTDMEQFNEHESLGPVNITDSGDMETVLSALSGARKTLRQSVNDYSIQSNYLVIRLNLSEEQRTLCLYAEGNTYYIEEPYVGVYKSNRDTSVAIYKIYNTALTDASIPENETLCVDSPNGAYAAEAYGTDTGITAAGRYPYEGLRVIRTSDGTTVWNGDGYYSAEFIWSGDSKYVAVYGEARTWGECFIVDAQTGQVIKLPDINIVSAQLDPESRPADNRPDPIFKAVEWGNDTAICVDYRWKAKEGEKIVSGTYEYDIVSGNIVSNTSKISDSPG